MTDLTPTPDQLQSWIDKVCYPHEQGVGPSIKDKELASLAFKAGADQELEACCEYIRRWFATPEFRRTELRNARRPKPPSLKDRALQAWAAVEAGTDDQTAMAVIRRALEALPE